MSQDQAMYDYIEGSELFYEMFINTNFSHLIVAKISLVILLHFLFYFILLTYVSIGSKKKYTTFNTALSFSLVQ